METVVYRLIRDAHRLDGLPFAAQAFVRALDSVRKALATEVGVSGTELRALARIAEEGRITPKALAESLEMSTPAVTAVANTLVGRGLVVRTEHPRDRRSLLLELTPEGHRIMEGVYRAFQRAMLDASEAFSPEKKSALEEGLLSLARDITVVPATTSPVEAGSTPDEAE